MPECTEQKQPGLVLDKEESDVQKYGSYRRKSDSRTIQRFYCKSCQSTFSNAIKDPAYYHKKRRINHTLKVLLSSSMSMRRAAKLLNVSHITIARKLIYLGSLCWEENAVFLDRISQDVNQIQFDVLQTIDHAKCKPLSIATVVSVHNLLLTV